VGKGKNPPRASHLRLAHLRFVTPCPVTPIYNSLVTPVYNSFTLIQVPHSWSPSSSSSSRAHISAGRSHPFILLIFMLTSLSPVFPFFSFSFLLVLALVPAMSTSQMPSMDFENKSSFAESSFAESFNYMDSGLRSPLFPVPSCVAKSWCFRRP